MLGQDIKSQYVPDIDMRTDKYWNELVKKWQLGYSFEVYQTSF